MGISYDAWRSLPGLTPEQVAMHPEAPSRPSQFKGGAGGCWRITIPRWRPATVNELMGSVARRIRLKKEDRAMIAMYGSRVPAATGPRRVHLAITLKGGRKAPDGDALWKSLLDALVRAKLLVDDDAEHAVLDPVEFVRGREPETTIELYDL